MGGFNGGYGYQFGTSAQTYQSIPIQWQVINQMPPGYQGNPSRNLDEVQAVQEELRRRHSPRRVQPNVDFFQITDANEERLFKPLLPANRYVHEDDHLEWLKGRTRSVCSRLKWAKAAYEQ